VIKTWNSSHDSMVKAGTYKQTGEFPLFLGPLFLHSDSDFGSCLHFSRIGGLISDDQISTKLHAQQYCHKL